MNKKGSKHLSLEQRKIIRQMLDESASCKSIAANIGCDERTISREVKKRRNRITNKRYGVYGTFDDSPCDALKRFPYIAKKYSLVPDNTATVLSKLENYFFVPALIIKNFMEYCTIESITQQYTLILYCCVALFLALVIAIPLSKVFENKDYYQRNIYKYALAYGNFSFMGNAIVPIILGEAELYHYMLYILPLNVAVYTWGLIILIPKGEEKQNVLKNLVNPIFMSIIIGAALGLLNAKEYIPSFLSTTISSCAACMGPLAMILTGFVVGGYNASDLLNRGRIYIASFLRLIVLPALFVTILWALGASKNALVLTLFAFGTPLGLNTVVFPAAYGGDTKTGASMALISNTFCIITIPLMYALLMSFPI